MTIVRGKYLLRGDIWFDEKPEDLPHVDVLYYYCQWEPPSIEGIEFDEGYTLLIALTKAEDELWKNIKKENRKKIRRAAEKDQVIYEFWNCVDSDILNNFFDFYNRFASQRGLKKLSKLEISRLTSYADAGVLTVSHTKSKEGNSLSWRTHYFSKNRVFPLRGALIRHNTDAAYNQMLGRANRYHRWQDILQFKNLGVLTYDFGGLHIGTTNEKQLNINSFKEGFGGEIVKQFNWRQGISIKGKLFLRLRKLLVD